MSEFLRAAAAEQTKCPTSRQEAAHVSVLHNLDDAAIPAIRDVMALVAPTTARGFYKIQSAFAKASFYVLCR